MPGHRFAWLIGADLSLRKQAMVRMFLVGLIASMILFTVGTLYYTQLTARELDLRRNQLQEYYSNTLPRLENSRLNAAVQLRSRLEFSRILEQTGPSRWPRLTAFLNAQWAFSEFSNLVVLDPNQSVLFHYGSEAATLQHLTGEDNAWLYVPHYGQFYRIYRMPLWLGMEGQGELILFRSLSNSLLRELAIPQTTLQLIYQDTVVATSTDQPPDTLNDRARYLRVAIPWTDTPMGGGPQPTLAAYRDTEDLQPYAHFVMRPVLVAVLIIVLLWFGLGRWLSLTTRRIAVLGQGAHHYAEHHQGGDLDQALAPALSHNDEVRETALAFRHLVDTVEDRDREQRAYLETLALLDEAVIEFDPLGRIQRASPAWHTLTHQDDGIGRCLEEFIHPDDRELLQTQIGLLWQGEKHAVTLRMRLLATGDLGPEAWIEARLLSAKHPESSRITGIRGVLRDITQTYLNEKQITHMALHDALTELPNRVLLEDRLKIALRLATRNTHRVGVCFIDLDHFKMINDTLGHKAGDRMLVAFSERLRRELRSGDTLARWGGDEFVLLLPDMDSENTIRCVTDKVVAALQQPLDLDGNEIRVTFSMGAAIYPIDGADMDTLFSHADRAMFYAKSQGRNQVCFFQDMATKGIGKKELYIQNRLAAAIDQHLIQAWFQPIVHATRGLCTSVEVLARWHDEEHGWISPATFIPMAENLGLIHDLGSQIMLASLDGLARLNALGHDIVLAVNISKRQLFIRSFAEWLLDEVTRRGLRPGQIVLEITESVALNDVERGADRVQELRQAGFLIAIDDFGTGYSSLSQLHEMSAVELKIDISFVRRLHEPAGKSMVQAIVNMANALGMKTVAEGVETPESAQQLAQMGVSCLQGYLFGKPMPLDAFEQWLAENAATGVTCEQTPKCADLESAQARPATRSEPDY